MMEDEEEYFLCIHTSPDSRIEPFLDPTHYKDRGDHHDDKKTSSEVEDEEEAHFPSPSPSVELENGHDSITTGSSVLDETGQSDSFTDEEEDVDLELSYETRPRSWWCNRFEELSVENKNMDAVVVGVFEERKAIGCDGKKSRFYNRQIARELISLVLDERISQLWRCSVYKLCHYLSYLSKFWNQFQEQLRNGHILDSDEEEDVKEDASFGRGKRFKMEENGAIFAIELGAGKLVQ